METRRFCYGCDRPYLPHDLVVYQENADRTQAEACSTCITAWIDQGMIWPISFSDRKRELGITEKE